jgi:hypothetical protein
MVSTVLGPVTTETWYAAPPAFSDFLCTHQFSGAPHQVTDQVVRFWLQSAFNDFFGHSQGLHARPLSYQDIASAVQDEVKQLLKTRAPVVVNDLSFIQFKDTFGEALISPTQEFQLRKLGRVGRKEALRLEREGRAAGAQALQEFALKEIGAASSFGELDDSRGKMPSPAKVVVMECMALLAAFQILQESLSYLQISIPSIQSASRIREVIRDVGFQDGNWEALTKKVIESDEIMDLVMRAAQANSGPTLPPARRAAQQPKVVYAKGDGDSPSKQEMRDALRRSLAQSSVFRELSGEDIRRAVLALYRTQLPLTQCQQRVNESRSIDELVTRCDDIRQQMRRQDNGITSGVVTSSAEEAAGSVLTEPVAPEPDNAHKPSRPLDLRQAPGTFFDKSQRAELRNIFKGGGKLRFDELTTILSQNFGTTFSTHKGPGSHGQFTRHTLTNSFTAHASQNFQQDEIGGSFIHVLAETLEHLHIDPGAFLEALKRHRKPK